MRETDLYAPVKQLLEAQGYAVKGEIGAADVVAVRGEEPPVIVELKRGFSLMLFHQAVERLRLTDHVYVAVPQWQGRAGWKSFVANRTLCRRLGLGLMTVDPGAGSVAVHLDPGPYEPRQSSARKQRLLREFQHRVGDPNQGGSARTGRLVTAYRQDALRCLDHLCRNGASKASVVAAACGVARARAIMSNDHYGWFERVERGIYRLTPRGEEAVHAHRQDLEGLR